MNAIERCDCPAEKPLRDPDGHCFSCGGTLPPPVSYVVVIDAGHPWERDVHRASSAEEATSWMLRTYFAREIIALPIRICAERDGERSTI